MTPHTPLYPTWEMLDTKLWLHEVCLKLEALEEAIDSAVLWCLEHDVESDPHILAVTMLSMLWTGYRLEEPLSKQLMLEMMSHPEWDQIEDVCLYLPPEFGEMELSDLLTMAVDIKLP